ncbi:MAG: arginine--tRNA ligase [Gemmatimonadetes bacterium]|nr:MAG: arginine--tRNA ligase [Gemmatimonadota bacterium]
MPPHVNDISTHLKTHIRQWIQDVFSTEFTDEIKLDRPPNPKLGDFAVGCFPLAKVLRQSPVNIAQKLAAHATKTNLIEHIQATGPYLNITLNKEEFSRILCHHILNESETFGNSSLGSGQMVMVEYSAPNTNKPLHLGHVRNQLLGMAVARLLEAVGYRVIKANLVNDRGVHICKSMLAYQRFGNGETPKSTGIKGDHFVGHYYVRYEQAQKAEFEQWLVQQHVEWDTLEPHQKEQYEAQFLKESQWYAAALDLLRRWEEGDAEVIALWQKMNQWVYEGFNQTYQKMGCEFDTWYYESDLYKSGKELILKGLSEGIFFKKEDGSIWVDLTDQNLDEKILLRSDGTSVYITQDIGTAVQKFKDYPLTKSIYVVGSEQNYHFQVLFAILKKLGYTWADECYHLSYGMVYLPEGKMKSREGKVVDADDLMAGMIDLAKISLKEREEERPIQAEELETISEIVGLGAIKYHILSFQPAKDIHFDPNKSISFQGDTGPYLQYAYARIRSIFRKSEQDNYVSLTPEADYSGIHHPKEIELVRKLFDFPEEVRIAAETYNPSRITTYLFELAKAYSQFYHACPVLNAENDALTQVRMVLCKATAVTLKRGLKLLGIDAPERM